MKNENRYKRDEYANNNPSWHIEDSQWKANQILKIIKRNSLTPSSIADIGCGAGGVLDQIHAALWTPRGVFMGYELSPYAYSLCKEREKKDWNSFLKILFLRKEIFTLT
jgi:SAM-dependent methyltransferase